MKTGKLTRGEKAIKDPEREVDIESGLRNFNGIAQIAIGLNWGFFVWGVVLD